MNSNVFFARYMSKDEKEWGATSPEDAKVEQEKWMA